MIIELTSSLPTFKPLKFKKGLNILVADRHDESTTKETRNGTGKTSFIELVHYLVAEKRNKNDDFHKSEIMGSQFCGKFLNDDLIFKICKQSHDKSDIVKINDKLISPKELRKELALAWFGLSEEITNQTYSPKFGALFSFFVRKDRNHGFSTPTMSGSKQKSWDAQVNLSYLLGFDWKLIQELQVAKDHKKDTQILIKMIKNGLLTGDVFNIDNMQTRLDLLDDEVLKKQNEVRNAFVVDGYRQHEVAANKLTNQIKQLNEHNLADLALIDDINNALKEVEEISINDLKSMYQQVGVFFSDHVKKRFEEVDAFHKQVAANRKSNLENELRSAKLRLAEGKRNINILQEELRNKLGLLKSGVAAERFTLLQSELNRLEAEQENLRLQIPRFKEAEEQKRRLAAEINKLVDLIAKDVDEREEVRKNAVRIFAESSHFLYNESGQLVIGRTDNYGGLSIQTKIVGGKSGGKNHMQIFCFDWLLVEVAKKKDCFPGFLIHDSHIFDGVDGRQIGLALSFAQKKCLELDVQYIVTMNSDDLQKIKNEEDISGEAIFDPESFIMETRLSDEANGGLFGVDF